MSQANSLKPQGRYRTPGPPVSQQGYHYDSLLQHMNPAPRSTFPSKVKFKVSNTELSLSLSPNALATKSRFGDLKICVVSLFLLGRTLPLCSLTHERPNILGSFWCLVGLSSELRRTNSLIVQTTRCSPHLLPGHVYLKEFAINHEVIAAENLPEVTLPSSNCSHLGKHLISITNDGFC